MRTMTKTTCLTLIFMTMAVHSSICQEPTTDDKAKLDSMVRRDYVIDKWTTLVGDDQVRYGIRYYANPLEQQTDSDLAMTFEPIRSAAVRTLLDLDEKEGLLVASVDVKGKGHEAGFRRGDLILSVMKESVVDAPQFIRLVAKKRGQETSATVRRKQADQQIKFTLAPADTEKNQRWIIGVQVDNLSKLMQMHLKTNGVAITAITKDSPAEKMGLLENDIICQINETNLSNLEELRTIVQESEGKKIRLDILRNGNKMAIELKPKLVENEPVNADQLLWGNLTVQMPNTEHTWAFDVSPGNKPPQQKFLLEYQNSETLLKSRLDQLSEQIEELKQQIGDLKKSGGK